MEFGVFHEFPRRKGQTEAESFAEGFEIVDAAERWGLDAMWLAELHFNPDRSVLAAPLTIATAIAARTERMQVGTAVQVLPLANPLRLAEEAATVDQISRGRLIFGVGRSGFARTYQAYGIPYAESRERFAESLEIITKAWTQPTFSHRGSYYAYENVCLMPKPYQKPHPPIRIAATSPDTFPNIGAQGYPLFVAVRLGTFSDLVGDLAAYRSAYRAAGHPGAGQAFIRVPVYVADTAEQAFSEPEDAIMQFFRAFAEQVARSAADAGTRAVERRAERGERLQALTWEDVRRDKAIVGTPAMVADRLQELREELGLNGILAELNTGGLIPHQRVLHSLHLLCDEVMPRFR